MISAETDHDLAEAPLINKLPHQTIKKDVKSISMNRPKLFGSVRRGLPGRLYTIESEGNLATAHQDTNKQDSKGMEKIDEASRHSIHSLNS